MDVPSRVAAASSVTVSLVAVATIFPAAGALYLGVGMGRAGVLVGWDVGMDVACELQAIRKTDNKTIVNRFMFRPYVGHIGRP
jgi:hypothetical protein